MTAPFNVGHDAQLNIIDGTTLAVITQFPPTTHFDFTPVTVNLANRPVNGQPIYREVNDGWKGTIEYDRYDGAIDDYFCTTELNYWNSGSYANGTITETVTERNGAVSQYKYLAAALKLETAGAFKAAEKVLVRISWCASTRIKVL